MKHTLRMASPDAVPHPLDPPLPFSLKPYTPSILRSAQSCRGKPADPRCGRGAFLLSSLCPEALSPRPLAASCPDERYFKTRCYLSLMGLKKGVGERGGVGCLGGAVSLPRSDALVPDTHEVNTATSHQK